MYLLDDFNNELDDELQENKFCLIFDISDHDEYGYVLLILFSSADKLLYLSSSIEQLISWLEQNSLYSRVFEL